MFSIRYMSMRKKDYFFFTIYYLITLNIPIVKVYQAIALLSALMIVRRF